MVRSTDPLTAATTSILLPLVRAAGFQRKTNRLIGRIRADSLQFFDLQLSGHGGKDFCVNYAALSLFHPRDYLVLNAGDRLTAENGAEAWLSASTHQAADAAMARVAEMFQAQALPFFESTKTIEGLLAHFQQAHWGSDHHLNLEKACCAAKLGHSRDARKFAERAIELYREDGRPCCAEGSGLCARLLAAIENESVVDLLREWMDHSVAKLGIEKLNPFRSVRGDATWLTSAVTRLAESIHKERAFDRLPILADALEEAGCTNREFLEICRQNGEYVRGCWVIDLLTGRR